MRTPFWVAIIWALTAVSTGQAQGFTEGWEFDGKAEAVLAVSTFDDVERLPARTVLGEVSLRATAEKTLDNSAEIGLRFEAKAQQDNPARAGFTGNIEPFAPDVTMFTGDGVPEAKRGAFSGLTRNGPVEDAGLQGVVETAQIYIDGGYGQASVGLGRGVAARFHEGSPDIFTHVRAANPKLDPAGLNIVRTENDLTAHALKLTYQTPRILGLRAGVSYTPKANAAGIDRDPRRQVAPAQVSDIYEFGVRSPELEDIYEVSAQFSRKLKTQDLRIRASASYAEGDIANSNADPISSASGFDSSIHVWNVGGELEFSTFSIGADYLSSNNGLKGEGDYTAWSAGITKEAFGWNWGARYGESEDQNILAQGKNWSIGGATKISQSAEIAIGYQQTDVDFGQLPFSDPNSASISAPQGVVVEITLSL